MNGMVRNKNGSIVYWKYDEPDIKISVHKLRVTTINEPDLTHPDQVVRALDYHIGINAFYHEGRWINYGG